MLLSRRQQFVQGFPELQRTMGVLLELFTINLFPCYNNHDVRSLTRFFGRSVESISDERELLFCFTSRSHGSLCCVETQMLKLRKKQQQQQVREWKFLL